MVVTGTRSDRSLDDVPVRTEVIPAAHIAFAASPKLAEVLDYQPGLRVESNCQNCNTSEIRMLGLQQRYLSLLTDGMATVSGLAGVYGIEQIPTFLVDRIEIVKGGASALYGPGAVAGVINLIPRDPFLPQTTADVTYHWMQGHRSGSRPNTDAHLAYEWADPHRRVGFLGYGMKSFVQGLDVDGDEFTEIARRDLYGAGLRSVFRPSDGIKLSVDYLFTHEDRRGGEDDVALNLPSHESLISEHLETARHVGTLLWRQEVSECFDFQAGFSAAHTGRDSYYGGIGPLGYAAPGTPGHDPSVVQRLATRFPELAPGLADPNGPFYRSDWTPQLGYGRTDNLLTLADMSANQRLGDPHTLSYGFQFRHESIEDDSGLERTLDADYQNYGVFAQHSWEFSDRLELVYGLRGDGHTELDDPIASPRAALRFSPSPQFDLRVAMATGFRAPEIFDEDLHVSNVGGNLEVIRPADSLREESSTSFSLSPDWRISNSWRLEGSLFYTRLDDTFFNDRSTDDPATEGIVEVTKINAGGAKVYGAELNIAYLHGAFTAELGLVEQRSRHAEPQLILGTPGDPLDNPVYLRDFERTPERYGVVILTYDPGRWSVFAAGKWSGPMPVPHVVNDPISGELLVNEISNSPWFFTVDLGLTHRWNLSDRTRLTAQAGVKNLFHSFQDDLDHGPFRDPAYVYGPRFPRTLYAGLKLQF